MQSIASDELDRSLIRGLAWTSAMKWGTQAVAWASTVVVARILSPADYGIVSLASVYYAILMLLSEFGVGTGVIAMRGLSQNQLAQMNSLAVLVGLGGFGLSCAIAGPAGHFFHAPQFPVVLIVMSGAFVINSFQSVPAGLLKRDLHFKLLSWIDGIRGLALAGFSVGLAFAGFHYWTLVLSVILSALLGTVLTLSQKRVRFAWPRFRELGMQIRFSRNVVIASLGWAICSNADFIVAGRVLGQVALGNYTVAWNFANAPLEKITSMVGSVTPAYFSAVQQDNSNLRRYLLKLTEAIAFLAFPVLIGMALVAHDAVILLLGTKWQGVIQPLQLLAVYCACRSVMPLMPQVLTARHRTGIPAMIGIFSAFLMPIAFLIGSRWGTLGIASAWAIAYPITAVPMFLYTAQEIDLTFGHYFVALRPAIDGCIIMALAVGATSRLLPRDVKMPVRLAFEVITGAVAYAAVQLLGHRQRLLGFRRAAAALR